MNNTRAYTLSLSLSLVFSLSGSLALGILSLSLSPHHTYLFTRARTCVGVRVCLCVRVCVCERARIRTENAYKFIKPSRAPPCRSSLVSDTNMPARCDRRLKIGNSRFRIINYFRRYHHQRRCIYYFAIIRQMRSGHLEKIRQVITWIKIASVSVGRADILSNENFLPRVYMCACVYACVFPGGPFFRPILLFLQ